MTNGRIVNPDKGFTLIELLVALLLLSLVIATVGTLITSSFQNVFSAGYKSEAHFLGQEAMENILADIAYNHPDANIVKDVVNDQTMNMDFPGVGPVSVKGKEVTITVTYTDSKGKPKTLVYKAFIPD